MCVQNADDVNTYVSTSTAQEDAPGEIAEAIAEFLGRA